MTCSPGSTDDHRALLAAPPRVPADPDRFSSNRLFGEPGIYPRGSVMTPAPGAALDEAGARAALVAAGLGVAADWMARPALVARAPDPGPRAGLAALAGTVAAPLLDAFVGGDGAVSRVTLGAPSAPGRVVGPPRAGDDPGARVVNDRYRAEHPALLGASLTHDLLWNPTGAGQYEECLLHALGAMVHVQLLAAAPALARRGTELARRQNSLAITLLNSRRPGSPDISLIAPDGPGTIPGGAPAMQTPDFWSIPFVPGPPVPGPAPRLLAPVLRAILEPAAALPEPLRYDHALGALVSEHLGREWLPYDAQLVASRALGLIPTP